jgi:hypothetical protein
VEYPKHHQDHFSIKREKEPVYLHTIGRAGPHKGGTTTKIQGESRPLQANHTNTIDNPDLIPDAMFVTE